MVFVESLVEVVDNSGGKQGRCIRILTPISVFCRRPGTLGNYILISLRRLLLFKKVKKSSIYKGLIVRTLRIVKRSVGLLNFDRSAIVLLNRKNEPLGSRIKGSIGKEIRENNITKVISLALGII
jgi:large subunit ribosomal protein L14